MAITTKAALAAELNVSKSRITQYANAGMPVRSDGKLNREDTLNWIADNRLSQNADDKGANRARKLVRTPGKPVATKPAVQGDSLVDLACALVRNAGSTAARNALKAGATLRTAYALEALTEIAMGRVAEKYLDARGISDFGPRGLTIGEVAGRTEHPIDWNALAREQGESFHEDEWYELVDSIVFPPNWQPPAGSPAALLQSRAEAA